MQKGAAVAYAWSRHAAPALEATRRYFAIKLGNQHARSRCVASGCAATAVGPLAGFRPLHSRASASAISHMATPADVTHGYLAKHPEIQTVIEAALNATLDAFSDEPLRLMANFMLKEAESLYGGGNAAKAVVDMSPPAPPAAPPPAPPPAKPTPAAAPAAPPKKSDPVPVVAPEKVDKADSQARYGPIIKGHEGAIRSLFKKIDIDGDGHLVAGELKDVVEAYTGTEFDEEQFFKWFDVHTDNLEWTASGTAKVSLIASPDSQLDLKEFGWYVADVAEGLLGKDSVASVIAELEKACEVVAAAAAAAAEKAAPGDAVAAPAKPAPAAAPAPPTKPDAPAAAVELEASVEMGPVGPPLLVSSMPAEKFELPRGHVETKLDRPALLAAQFRAFDDDGDGAIGIDEFSKQFYKQYQVDDATIAENFKKLDKDGDGSIDMKEFIIWKLEDTKFDDDGLFTSMQTAVTERVTYNLPLPAGHVETKLDRPAILSKQFKAFDNDNDGAITLPEFLKMFDTADIDKDGKIDPEIQKKFQEMDVDGDGTVSVKEFITWKLKECMADDDGMFESMQNTITENIKAAK